MGISVDVFVKTYKATSKAKDKTFEDFIEKHITTKYIDYTMKCVWCDGIVKASCYVKDGDRVIVNINSANRYLFFIMRLIQLYTDIEFKEDEVVQTYDKLNEIGAINSLISAIPKDEYNEFTTILNMKMDDFRENKYSLTAILNNIIESLSLSEEVINSVMDDLTKQAE